MEPSATLYDNHNDNSVNTSLWTTSTVANGTVSEVSSAQLKVFAPGTATGGDADKDRALIYQDTAGGSGMKCTGQYTMGNNNYCYGRVGVTDSATTGEGITWSGNYIAIQVGTYASPGNLNNATLYSSGYTVTTDNGPIALLQSTDYDFKIYENGDGTIQVYIGASQLAVLSGTIATGSFIQYEARAATDANRQFTWLITDSYDYADNATTTSTSSSTSTSTTTTSTSTTTTSTTTTSTSSSTSTSTTTSTSSSTTTTSTSTTTTSTSSSTTTTSTSTTTTSTSTTSTSSSTSSSTSTTITVPYLKYSVGNTPELEPMNVHREDTNMDVSGDDVLQFTVELVK